MINVSKLSSDLEPRPTLHPRQLRHPQGLAGPALSACTSTSSPTSASWLNFVERFFSELMRHRLKPPRGPQRRASSRTRSPPYIRNRNRAPIPFVDRRRLGHLGKGLIVLTSLWRQYTSSRKKLVVPNSQFGRRLCDSRSGAG